MYKFFEEEASFMKSGGSWYLKVSPTYYKFIGLKQNANNELISDAKFCAGLGKHGKFLYLYSPRDQKKYLKEKKEQEKQTK